MEYYSSVFDIIECVFFLSDVLKSKRFNNEAKQQKKLPHA